MQRIVISTSYGRIILSDEEVEYYNERSSLKINRYLKIEGTDRAEIGRDNTLLLEMIEKSFKEFENYQGALPYRRTNWRAIVEIPDGIEWRIEDYDGLEWVAEKHRKWDQNGLIID